MNPLTYLGLVEGSEICGKCGNAKFRYAVGEQPSVALAIMTTSLPFLACTRTNTGASAASDGYTTSNVQAVTYVPCAVLDPCLGFGLQLNSTEST